MIYAIRRLWWQFMEHYAASKIRTHRVELTTWIIQRDIYRGKLGKSHD